MTAEEVARICALEAHYWAERETKDEMTFIAIGAMSAASNICAAIIRQVSPEEFQKEIETRPK